MGWDLMGWEMTLLTYLLYDFTSMSMSTIRRSIMMVFV